MENIIVTIRNVCNNYEVFEEGKEMEKVAAAKALLKDAKDFYTEEQILDLNLKYMEDENTVILAIHDATQDIGVCEALKQTLHRYIDPGGKRTKQLLTIEE